MRLLALDTTTEACSVAVWCDGAVFECFEPGNRHSERILSMVTEALAEAGLALAQLDAIAFGRGPGSFTGLRIGAGVAQGLAFGVNLPVVPVSSLAALAQEVDAPKVLAALDARMNQVYWGAYVRKENELVELAGTESVMAPAQVPLPEGEGWIGAGSGWNQYAQLFLQRLGAQVSDWRRDIVPRARSVAALAAAEFVAGRTVPPEQALPVYLRDDVAAKMKPAR